MRRGISIDEHPAGYSRGRRARPRYLPAEDLQRFGVTADELAAGTRSQNFSQLMRFEVERARRYYAESAPLVDLIDPPSRPSLRALVGIYAKLLERIEELDYDVFSRRVALSPLEKSLIVARAAMAGKQHLKRCYK